MNLKQRLVRFLLALKNAVTTNPAECFLCVSGVVVGFLTMANTSDSYPWLIYFPMLFLLLNIANYYAKKPFWRWCYYLLGLLATPLLWIDCQVNMIYFRIGLAVVVLVYFSYKLQKDNVKFAENAASTTLSLAMAMISAGLTFSLTLLTTESISYLFNLKLVNNYPGYVAFFLFIGVAPLLFLAFNDKPLKIDFQHRFFDIILNYILTPALIIYGCVLYFYFSKILIKGELPIGNVAYMVFGFSIYAYLLKFIYPLFNKPIYGWFYSNLSYFVLPSLVMFWVGTFYRINTFGFTETRVYLSLVGFFITAASFVLLSRKLGRFLYLALSLALLLSVFTFIPRISANDIGLASQEKRYTNAAQILGVVDADSRVLPLDTTPENNALLRQLCDSFDYIFTETNSEYTLAKLGIANSAQLEKVLGIANCKISWGKEEVSVFEQDLEKNDSIVVEKLLETTTSWDGDLLPNYPSGQPKVSVLKITIPQGERLPTHYHPIINVAVVLQGTLKVMKTDGKEIVIHQGEVISEVVGKLHYGVNEGDIPVELIVFYAGDKKSPLSIKEH